MNNLQETIRKILMEQNIPSTSTELIKNLPEELKKLFFNQWKAKQNPKWHPEGNTLKHIIVVLNRAYANYPDDPNMIMAALFHDLGKSDTYKINPKTGEPTAYGHEDVSTKYVEKFKDWIESFNGTDVDEIKYLVKNHMKVKPSTWDAMRDTKKEPIQKHPAFDKLMGFTDKLDGGGTEIRKSIKEAIKEVLNEMEVPVSIRRRINMTEQDIINYLRKFMISQYNYNPNAKIDVSVSKACRSTAYEILDSTHTSIDDNTFQILEYELTEYLKNKYGEQTKDFIQNFFNPSGDDEGTTYMFRKHSEKDGNSGMGRGFSQHFETWNELLMSYGTWFPSLDWADVKEKLDSMPDRKQLLISEPGDKNNTMNYYFSLVKIKKDDD